MSVLLAAPPSPFKGLTPFGDSDLDALLFFGREREREIVVANLMASRFTVLYGPSGVGKTSLLGAGVAHEVRKIRDVAIVVFSSWPGDPVAALKEEIAEACGLGYSGDSLADTLAAATRAIGGDVYVILDQFEEFFLYQRDGLALIDEVAEAVGRPRLRANFLIGIREDALALLDAFKPRLPGFFANSLRLGPLDRRAGEAAIVGPINAYNGLVDPGARIEVEPEVVTRVLDEVAAGKVDLGRAGRGSVGNGDQATTDRIEAPYLQLVLERLWQVERASGSTRLRAATLLELGGAAQIVEDHLARAMAGLTPREQDAAAAMYNHLVTPSGTKIAHGVSDLAGYAGIEENEAAAVLQRLSADRIVRAGENGGAGRYEIFHDVLADAVLAWRAGHETDRRLEGERQAAARRHRALIRLMAAVMVALAVLAAIAIYALVQRSEARHQAVAAKRAQVTAQQAAVAARQARNRAQAARNHAQAEKRLADKRRAVAQQATERARRAAAAATAASARADRNARVAEGATRAAKHQAAIASQQKAQAVRSERSAKRQQHRAQLAETRAIRQKKIAHARQLAADAKALLTEDPERSVRTSLSAARAFRSAGLDPGPAVEDTLREGLVNLRVKAVLPGGGPVHATAFSPDGSLLVVAGTHGARIFDRAHRFASRQLQPATGLAAVAFSPDGRLFAGAGSGRNDRQVHVWDVQSGALLYSLPTDGAIRDVTFSADGRLIATAGADGYARLWSVAGGLPLAAFLHPRGAVSARAGVWAVAFNPDSKRLLTVGGDRFARVWDVDTQKLLLQLNSIGFVNSARFSHDGRLIATVGNDPFVRIWDAQTGELKYAFRQASGGISDVAFSPDDALVATAGEVDAIARVWRLSDKSVIAMQTVHLSGVEQVLFSPNGRSVISRGRDRNVYIWSADGGFRQATLVGHRSPVTDVSLSPDGDSVLTGSDDGTARLWSAEVNVRGPTPPAAAREIGSHPLAVNAVQFSTDDQRIVSAGADGTARVWGPGKRVEVLRHDGAVTDASFSRDGKLVITASTDGTARIWRTADGTLVRTLTQGAPLLAAKLSPDGRTAITAGSDGSALLWDVRRGVVVHRLRHEGQVEDARFSPDGTRVVTASDDDTAAIWSVSSGQKIATLAGHTDHVVTAVFSPNGRWIATASADNTARIWNAATGTGEHELVGHGAAITAVAFSPNSSLLATSSMDRDVRLWNVRTGEAVAVLRIHAGFVADVAFSSDGRWLASAGPGEIGIWQTKSRGEWPLLPLYLVQAADRPTNAVAFSRRGWRIVSGSRDGSVRTFNCTLCGQMKELSVVARARLHEIARPNP